MSEQWTDGFTDPTVLAFLAAHGSPPPPRVEMLVDASNRIWVYDTNRDGWFHGNRFIGDENRGVLEALHGPCTELAI